MQNLLEIEPASSKLRFSGPFKQIVIRSSMPVPDTNLHIAN